MYTGIKRPPPPTPPIVVNIEIRVTNNINIESLTILFVNISSFIIYFKL